MDAIPGMPSHDRSNQTAGARLDAKTHGNDHPKVLASPDNAEALQRLAVTWSGMGRTGDAIACLQRAAMLKPEHAGIYTELGVALASQGRLEEAEANFRQVIKLRDSDAGGHNHLGTVLAAQAKWEEATRHYRQALRLRPDFAAAHANLAVALAELERVEEALQSYETALRYEPNSAETYFHLGNMLESQGRRVEAMECYRRALALRPDTVEVQCRLAAALVAEGNRSEALELARRALRRGGSAATCFELGTLFLRLGQFDEAIACYCQSLRLHPHNADALNNLGTAFWEQGHWEQAEACYRQALRIRHGDPEILNNLGIALREQGRLEEAVALYQEAVCHRGDVPEILANLGVVLSDMGEVNQAEARIRRALQLRPDWAVALDNLGTTYLRQARYEEALECYEQALRIQDDYAEARRNRAMAWLSLGDFERGWPEYEWRWSCRGSRKARFSQPRWEGESLAGRTILLHAEQGLGDTLQFIRYARSVKQRGGTVLLACQQPLVQLLVRASGLDRVLTLGSSLPAFDVHVPLLSLPEILGTTLATIPADIPYVFADPEAIERWSLALTPISGLRVGIAWQGNLRYRMDRQRSFPLAKLGPLAGIENVCLINLQKGFGLEQIDSLAGVFSVTVLDGWKDERVGDFPDTAAIMKNLDLVITPDTALAHLAGALGVRVWLALPRVAEWRWLNDREDSPWYPTMRLFRQSRAGDWDELFERMAQTMKSLN